MVVSENEQFTKDYYDAQKRYIGNAIQVFFKDGSKTERVAIDFPIGHRKRRAEGIPVLQQKFEAAIERRLPEKQCEAIVDLCADQTRLEMTPVDEFMGHWVI